MAMPEIPDELAGRAEVLRELSRDGGPLSPEAPRATINDPEWFRQLPNGELVPTAQRRELHRELLAQFYEENGRGDQGHQAVMLAGPPGAGKGSIRAQVLAEAGERFTVVDPDEFKVLLIRAAVEDGSIQRMMPPEATERGVELAPMELAALVHEESSMLAGRVRQQAIRHGENIVVDGVLANEAKALRLAGQLACAGYDVQVVDVEVPAEVSRQRIAQRWVEQTKDSELGGRWVPSEFRESVFDVRGGANSRCDQAARAVAEQVDGVSRYRRYFTTAEQARQEVATPRLTAELRRDRDGAMRAVEVPKKDAPRGPRSAAEIAAQSFGRPANQGAHTAPPSARPGPRTPPPSAMRDQPFGMGY